MDDEKSLDDFGLVLKAELQKLKADGHTAIALDNLLAWLSALPPAHERARRFEEWKARLPHIAASQIETFKSALEAGQTALKTLLAMNGGASVALLAFLGNLLGKERPLTVVAGMNKAMLSFLVGVFLVGLSSASRYLTQLCAANEHNEPIKAQSWRKKANIFIAISIVAGLGSLVTFCIGGLLAYGALQP